MVVFKSIICQEPCVLRSAALLCMGALFFACTNHSIRTPRNQTSGAEDPIRSIAAYQLGQCPIRGDVGRYSVTIFSDGVRVEGYHRAAKKPDWVQRIEFDMGRSTGPSIERLKTLLTVCGLSQSSQAQLSRWGRYASRGRRLNQTERRALADSLMVDFARYAKAFSVSQKRLKALFKLCPSVVPKEKKELKLALQNCVTSRNKLNDPNLHLDQNTRDKSLATLKQRITALKRELTFQNNLNTLGQLCNPKTAGEMRTSTAIEKNLGTLAQLMGPKSNIDPILMQQCVRTRRVMKKTLDRLRKEEKKAERERVRRCAKNRARIAVPMRTLVSLEYAEKIGVRLRKLSKQLRSKARAAIRKRGLSSEQQQFIECATDAFGAADDIMRGIYQMHQGRYAREWLRKGRFEEVQENVMRRASQPGPECRGFVLGGLTRRILGPIDTYLTRVQATPAECKSSMD